MAAHVADQDGGDCVVQLGREIGHIHPVIRAHLDQNRHAVGVQHRRGHSRKGKSRDQDARAAWQIKRLERQEQRGRTGRHRQRITRAKKLGKFGLQQRDGGTFGGGIAEQIARLQQAVNLDTGGFGDRFCVIDIRGEDLTVGCHVQFS